MNEGREFSRSLRTRYSLELYGDPRTVQSRILLWVGDGIVLAFILLRGY